MASEDIPKTAIVTPFGMFEFLHLPLGLRNAGNTFQRMMDQILGNLPYCFVYINNILVFSPDLSSHVQNLRDVLVLCHAYGLTIGLGKTHPPSPSFLHLTNWDLSVSLVWLISIKDFSETQQKSWLLSPTPSKVLGNL